MNSFQELTLFRVLDTRPPVLLLCGRWLCVFKYRLTFRTLLYYLFRISKNKPVLHTYKSVLHEDLKESKWRH